MIINWAIRIEIALTFNKLKLKFPMNLSIQYPSLTIQVIDWITKNLIII